MSAGLLKHTCRRGRNTLPSVPSDFSRVSVPPVCALVIRRLSELPCTRRLRTPIRKEESAELGKTPLVRRGNYPVRRFYWGTSRPPSPSPKRFRFEFTSDSMHLATEINSEVRVIRGLTRTGDVQRGARPALRRHKAVFQSEASIALQFRWTRTVRNVEIHVASLHSRQVVGYCDQPGRDEARPNRFAPGM